jgi:hypothetical protein
LKEEALEEHSQVHLEKTAVAVAERTALHQVLEVLVEMVLEVGLVEAEEWAAALQVLMVDREFQRTTRGVL